MLVSKSNTLGSKSYDYWVNKIELTKTHVTSKKEIIHPLLVHNCLYLILAVFFFILCIVLLFNILSVVDLYAKDFVLLSSVVPVKTYFNTYAQRSKIIKDNKNKSGIYRWINIKTGHFYVGSSIDLGRRFSHYFSISFLKASVLKNKSIIYNSLLKRGYSNFCLEILEYCDKESCIERENFFFNFFKTPL